MLGCGALCFAIVVAAVTPVGNALGPVPLAEPPEAATKVAEVATEAAIAATNPSLDSIISRLELADVRLLHVRKGEVSVGNIGPPAEALMGQVYGTSITLEITVYRTKRQADHHYENGPRYASGHFYIWRSQNTLVLGELSSEYPIPLKVRTAVQEIVEAMP